MADRLNRRDFLKVLTVASEGVFAACSSSQPQKLIPYVVPPDDMIPGVSTWYKSVCRECPAGCGTLVRTREGRVVKVEGNPDHPVNRGALAPANLTSLLIQQKGDGHFYGVIRNGLRGMPQYHEALSPQERWQVVLYVRTLAPIQSGLARKSR